MANTGNVTLDPIAVTDLKVGAVSCPVTVLAPAESTTCTATYALTQTDVDAGHVANTAAATGTPPAGLTAPRATDSTDTPIAAGPALTLDKQAAAPSGNTAGDSIDYTFVVTNVGNVTLTGLTIDDPTVGTVNCPTTTLAPGDSTTCTATYTLTQADVDAGEVINNATATGTDPTGTDATATDSTTTPIPPDPSIGLDKLSGGVTDVDGNGQDAGDTVAYSFVVTNTGNVTLDPVSVDDPLVGPVTCPVTQLAPGDSTTCSATYTLTQEDVDAGVVTNEATANGTPPTGADVTATDTIDTPIGAGPAITLDKQAGVPTGNNAGDTIDYTFVVTNSGNVTLTGVSVDDPVAGAVTCTATTVAPGASTTCTATYTLTQADVDAGQINNTATATGNPPTGAAPIATGATTTPIEASPIITIDKQAGVPSGNAAGDTIDYTFLVANTGNVTLDPISVTDPLTGPVSCLVTLLAPAVSTTCTATYTLTQADVDAGHVANTAIVQGLSPAGAEVTASDSTDTPLTAGPVITLDKIAGTPSGATAGRPSITVRGDQYRQRDVGSGVGG